MPSWRTLASAASRSFKGYVNAQRESARRTPQGWDRSSAGGQDPSFRQVFGQWAGQKLRGLQGGGEDAGGTTNEVEKLSLFPGWAARRYRTHPSTTTSEDAPFDVDVFVSGFASKLSGPGFGTRAGKTFLRLAKSTSTNYSEPRYSEDLLDVSQLPPRPDDMTDEAELKALEQQMRDLEVESQHSSSSSVSSSSSTAPGDPSNGNGVLSDNLRKWHSNLEARLHPFWSSALSGRTVRLSLYTSDPTAYAQYSSPPLNDIDACDDMPECRPIAAREVMTAQDGSFQVKFGLAWEEMCVHPGGVHIAFGDPEREVEFWVVASLMPNPSRPPTPSYNNPQKPYGHNPSFSSTSQHYFSSSRPPTVTTSISIPLTNTTVRVISDIDDTVKNSGVLMGARAVFHNVFVKELEESVIPGMGDWYTSMWKRGVRFHYVSNGPFELLPTVLDFLNLSNLPPGSIKLRSYASRTIFSSLFTPSNPAERKRQGVEDVLNSFPDAKFFLVGDSGEQDLELYASLARARPGQILGVFIRDAGVGPSEIYGGGGNSDVGKEGSLPLEDPTGEGVFNSWGYGGPGSNPSSLNGSGYGEIASMPTTPILSSSSSSQPPFKSTPELDFISPRPVLKMTNSPTTDEPMEMSMNYPPVPPKQERYENEKTREQQSQRTPTSATAPSFSRSSSRSSTLSNFFFPTNSYNGPQQQQQQQYQQLTELERKRHELQMRVYRARMEMPRHIPLRVFRNPKECVELTKDILDRLHVGTEGKGRS
ncbi:hypothetical protein K474DRAFT_1684169 [Panus rudis PR-1116 ss-1]|nr:hypothetical protein K474DRAFT_1684169 [Panus rudis PR-1116 ss-1]